MRRLLDTDPLTGIQTWHEYDATEKKTRIFYVPTRDIADGLDACKMLANDDDYTKKGIKQEWWHYGWVPDALMLKWLVEEGVPLDDAEEYNRRLNWPEYKHLKVTTKYHPAKDSKIFIAKK